MKVAKRQVLKSIVVNKAIESESQFESSIFNFERMKKIFNHQLVFSSSPINPEKKALQFSNSFSNDTNNVHEESLKGFCSNDNDPLILENFLKMCQPSEIIDFDFYLENYCIGDLLKLGEGVFSEVFGFKNTLGINIAFKVMPVGGTVKYNETPQKKLDEISSELTVLSVVSEISDKLNGLFFPCLERINLVKGQFPAKLLKVWDEHHNSIGSENDNPRFFSDEQLFVIFQTRNNGISLEDFTFTNPSQAKSILIQVCLALAKGEELFKFEHRDLHTGNILCLEDRGQESKTYSLQFADFGEILYNNCGVDIFIIDFSLSSMKTNEIDIAADLQLEQSIFEGEGDKQFDVYRTMKDFLRNNWINNHKMKTNIFWIEYLIEKLLEKAKNSQSKEDLKSVTKFLNACLKNVLNYESSSDFVKNFLLDKIG